MDCVLNTLTIVRGDRRSSFSGTAAHLVAAFIARRPREYGRHSGDHA